ncbi:MAG: VanZ family protein [Magnetococcales bacterium]|nr:VanZ family protein [Magnetococcales bacterium]
MQREAIGKLGIPVVWKKKGLLGIMLGVYSGLLYYLSSLTGQQLSAFKPYFQNQDKVEHMIAYGVMAFVAWVALRQWNHFRHSWLWAWLYAVGYGISDEWHQFFVPGRYADVWDLMADATGAALAILILEFYRSRRQSQSRPLAALPQSMRYSVP